MSRPSLRSALVAGSLLLAVVFALLYIMSSETAVVINGLCEMLYSGGTKGLMMYYHDAGNDFGLTAVGASLIAVLIPAIKPQYLWMANTGYYGSFKGGVLTVVGVAVALVLLFGWGKLLAQLLNRAVPKRPKWLQMAWVVMSLCVASLYWPGWMALALGLWNPLEKR